MGKTILSPRGSMGTACIGLLDKTITNNTAHSLHCTKNTSIALAGGICSKRSHGGATTRQHHVD